MERAFSCRIWFKVRISRAPAVTILSRCPSRCGFALWRAYVKALPGSSECCGRTWLPTELWSKGLHLSAPGVTDTMLLRASLTTVTLKTRCFSSFIPQASTPAYWYLFAQSLCFLRTLSDNLWARPVRREGEVPLPYRRFTRSYTLFHLNGAIRALPRNLSYRGVTSALCFFQDTGYGLWSDLRHHDSWVHSHYRGISPSWEPVWIASFRSQPAQFAVASVAPQRYQHLKCSV